MSVVVTLGDGTDHVVAVGTAATVGALVDVVHEALELPYPAGAYDVRRGEGDVVSECICAEAPLEDVGIYGCEERLHFDTKHVYIARAQLEADGVAIETEAAATAALRDARIAGAMDRMRLLAASGTPDLWSQARAALADGDYDFLSLLLTSGAAHFTQHELDFLLPSSVANDAPTDVVVALLDMGAEVRPLDPEGVYPSNPPLHYAVHSNLDIADTLLRRGADVNARDKWGDTPLHWACDGDGVAAALLLLAYGADVESSNSVCERPLHRACVGACTALVGVLLDAGADVTARGGDGRQPLHVAAACGQTAVAEALLRGGASVDAECDEGPAVMLAYGGGHTDTAALLLDHGASIDVDVGARLTRERERAV